jgi:iron complex transport system substrate-binding protein
VNIQKETVRKGSLARRSGRMSRRKLLKIGGASIAGAALFGVSGCGGSGGQGGASGGTRTIKHGLGETEVPERPERVATLYSATDVALAVGLKPVAVDAASASAEYLNGRLEEAENIGQGFEPNLEKLAALEPDLILGLDVVVEQVYDQLSEIAPTVGVEFGETSGDWKRYNRDYAEALGRTGEFEGAMDDYEKKTEGFREKMGDRLGGTEVAIMRASPENLRFDLPGIFIGDVVYDDAGLRLPSRLREPAKNPENYTLEISREEFGRAEGSDALFVWNVTGEGPEKDEEEIEEILSDPLFGRLDVVREGRVYRMGDHWFSESVLGASMVLDDLEKHLVKGDAR